MKPNHSYGDLSSNWVEDLKTAIPNGSQVVVVCSRGSLKRGILESIRSAIIQSEITIEILAPETPDLTFLQEIFEPVSKMCVDYIVAVGGGSVLDTAKAIKMFFSVEDWADFQHQVKYGVSSKPNGCQIVAIPTTAGSGSEFTPFATLWDRQESKKLSIDSPWLLPNTQIVDPILLSTLSGDKLLYPALDAISHSVESLWSKKKTPESREYALSALSFSHNAIASFKKGTSDLTQFALASTHAGRAIAISRTALAHSISYPLTLTYGVPHGLACSFTLGEIFLLVNEYGELDEEEFHHIETILDLLGPLKIGSRISDYCSIDEVYELIPRMSSSERSDNISWSAVDFDLFSILYRAITQ
jgi:alcohol dehydrogenase class IV